MATFLSSARTPVSLQSLRLIARTSPWTLRRALSTLPENPHIYVHERPQASPKSYILSYLSTEPANPSIAIGTTTQLPPTPDSFTPNPSFLDLVHTVISAHAAHDPDVQAQAQIYASQAGASLGSGGAFFPRASRRSSNSSSSRRQSGGGGGGGGTGGDGAGGASAQGGIGGAGRGGYIHVSDQRNPPDFGRVSWPEDIFGSLELDGSGAFVDAHGRYQRANTYRVVTREGVLGLSPYLRERVVEKLRELEGQARTHG